MGEEAARECRHARVFRGHRIELPPHRFSAFFLFAFASCPDGLKAAYDFDAADMEARFVSLSAEGVGRVRFLAAVKAFPHAQTLSGHVRAGWSWFRCVQCHRARACRALSWPRRARAIVRPRVGRCCFATSYFGSIESWNDRGVMREMPHGFTIGKAFISLLGLE